MTAITCPGCQHAYEESALFCPNCGRAKVRASGTDPLVGKLLGERFEVLELIGQGGSGTIYKAEHVTLRRRVAIKVLHDELSRDDLAVERFRREATTVAEIDNEHIVEIHDFGRAPDGRLYLAMELLEGETLDTVLMREKQLSVERTADILIQVGEALMEAHAIGYVHRDLRPRNLYLANRRGKANFVKLLDFGLAKLVETDAQGAASTSLGMTFGDPRYMSPEQARGDRIDRRADIYQLGCVAYEMLTGAPPFTGNRVFDILTKQVAEAPVPLPTKRPGVPLWMEAAVAKMLAKDSDNRFATTTRMVEALRRGLETGEVMDDEIARRRESVPPPSVSRVMQKMGITPDAGLPAFSPKETTKGIPPVPAAVTAKPDSVELVRKRTGTPQLGVPVVKAGSTRHASEAAGTIEPPLPPMPRADSRPYRDNSIHIDDVRPTQPYEAARRRDELAESGPYHNDEPVRRRPIDHNAAAGVSRPMRDDARREDSRPYRKVDEPRDRRDSRAPRDEHDDDRPRRGDSYDAGSRPHRRVDEDSRPHRRAEESRSHRRPGSEPAARRADSESDRRRRDDESRSAAFERPRRESQAPRDEERPRRATQPPPRTKRPTGGNTDAWFEEGDADQAAPQPRRKNLSASTTDLSLYDEPRSRRGLALAAVVGIVIIGGVAFALTRGGSDTAKPTTEPVATAPTPDAAPSTIINEQPAPPPVDKTPAPPIAIRSTRPTGPVANIGPIDNGPIDVGRFVLGGNPTPTPPPTPVVTPDAGTTVVNPNPPTNPVINPGAGSGSGLNGGPQDPYGGGDPGVGPEQPTGQPQTAQQLAAQGLQQLSAGELAAAAINFKKALELDPNNAMATLGMGDIAVRQALWSDAIAHLTKAVKLSPGNGHAHTLLGEAYLRTNQPSAAAASFKKALQIDANNARARDGYNEAAAKEPPPKDE